MMVPRLISPVFKYGKKEMKCNFPLTAGDTCPFSWKIALCGAQALREVDVEKGKRKEQSDPDQQNILLRINGRKRFPA